MRRIVGCLVAAVVVLTACREGGTVGRRERVDSLNRCAYEQHYRSTDSTEMYARMVLDGCGEEGAYADERNEALCHLAFARAMRMDYDTAQVVYRQVLDGSAHELLKLVADIGMMRICQRRSANKELYDYALSAERRMRRIAAEESLMDEGQSRLWNYAQSDYHLTLSIYYYYVRQEERAQEEIECVGDHLQWVEDDPQQLAFYYFLGGNARSSDKVISEDNMRHIMRCLSVAYYNRHPYLYSKALTTLADDMIQTGELRPGRMNYLRELLQIPDTVEVADYSLFMSLRALRELKQYGSPFDIAQTYITIADYYLYGENPEMALDAMQRIEVPAEADGSPKCPELMVDVREHLSMVYSALGMKPESDENRNIYLDILDATRQDRMMEQRLDSLRSEQRTLNRTVLIAGIVLVLLVALVIYFSRRLRANYAANYFREQAVVEHEMEQWRERSDEHFSTLAEEQEEVEAGRYSNEQRLADQKCQYADRLTCLSLVGAMTPFLDRALNEIRKMKIGGVTATRLTYLGELIERINLYNEILSHWVKVRQGQVALHIENFAVQPLLDILGKNTNAFKSKGISLTIRPTEAIVKADRALTLFMLNTLLENARKYTPQGGAVEVAVEDAADYVELSIRDTGRGLSQEDVSTILSEKVYDSSRIGAATSDDDLLTNKGHGFGLMNCKGIIDKYRKSGAAFGVCLFSVESALGKGSRFFFRLPKGVLRVLGVVLCLFVLCTAEMKAEHLFATDSLHLQAKDLPNDPLLEQASAYADSAYFANIDGRYADALQFADSACARLNDFYLSQQPDGDRLMRLETASTIPEIDLWNEGFRTDYHIILDLRNEAAVAALALNKWDVYYYNNEVYTRLYKLMAQDTTLEQFCNDIKATNTNRQTLLIIGVLVLLALLFAYYLTYYRNNILPTFNLRQVLALNRRLFETDDERQLADIIDEGVNEIRRTDGVALALCDGPIYFSRRCPQRDFLHQLLQHPEEHTATATYDDGHIRLYPLLIDDRVIGVIALLLHNPQMHKGDEQLFDLLARHTAINIYYSLVRTERLRTEIELAADERRRAETEANHVHVQNMVMDNNLSTIKHETMYYPSRIHQIVCQLQKGDVADEQESLATLDELATYYKEVFTLLSANAARQMEDVNFRRQRIPVARLVNFVRKRKVSVSDDQPTCDVLGDEVLVRYLLDNLIGAFLQMSKDADIVMSTSVLGGFVQFQLSMNGRGFSTDELHAMFYPETLRYDADTDTLHGAQMLIAKQIVRLHDDYVRRGCRIEARPANSDDASGLCILFTLPSVRQPLSPQ
ncbi:MAG: DUF5113 domain-containing protein [Bacteroidaceae bacterium]|nr:DUF5113 domain-containing protein [Bacteroidaceae bacterium]